MARANLSGFLRRLTRGMAAEMLHDESDRQLVERALAGRDDAAFGAIVHRHGAMVYRVCWRVLQHPQDAEDALQATFLVLAQKLRSVCKHASLASWLHGVAHRVALKARAKSAARRRREQQASRPDILPPNDVTWGELRSALDFELSQLPEQWRLPLILCYLEGRTQDEAARELSWSKSTLRRRLEEARDALGSRLEGRGIVWCAALSTVLISDCLSSAAPAPAVVAATVQAGAGVAAGKSLILATSARVAALTEGVMKTMCVSKFKMVAGLLLVVGCACAAAFAQVGGPAAEVRATVGAGRAGVLDTGGAGAAPRSDADKLKGVWKVVRHVIDGEELKERKGDRVLRMYFSNGTVHEMFGEHVAEVYSFTLDEKEKPPTIDLTSDRHGTIEAIYRMKGDELTICRPIRGKEGRPTAFASAGGSDLELLVLKRDAKAPKLDLEKVKAELKVRNDRRPVAKAMMTIVAAMRNYHDDKGTLPPAVLTNIGKDKALLSWRVALLPYLGEEELYKEFRLDEPWDSEHNKKLLDKMPSVYGDEGNETAYQVIVGPDAAFDDFLGSKPRKLSDIADGEDRTILLAVGARRVPWTKPADLRYLSDKPLPKLGGQFKEGFHVAVANGAVFFVPSKFNEKALRAFITIAGGEAATFDDLMGTGGKDKKKR
jgi:RNA polymerase sigma factor (sigma-70 family)